MRAITGIYKITSPTGRVYIGQSVNIGRRKRSHQRPSKRTPRLKRSIDKYGWKTHIFEIIEECNNEDLNCYERYWQDFYNSTEQGLNCTLTQCGEKRYKHSIETINKIRKTLTGENNPMYGRKFSDEHRRRLSESSPKHNLGKTFSKKTKQKMSENHADFSRGNHHNAKLVLCTQTGVFYECVLDASEAYNIGRRKLADWLKNQHRNKTNLIYV